MAEIQVTQEFDIQHSSSIQESHILTVSFRESMGVGTSHFQMLERSWASFHWVSRTTSDYSDSGGCLRIPASIQYTLLVPLRELIKKRNLPSGETMGQSSLP